MDIINIQNYIFYEKVMSSRTDALHCNALQIFKSSIIHMFSRFPVTYRKTGCAVTPKHEHSGQRKIYSVLKEVE